MPPVAPLDPSELVLLPAAAGLLPEFSVWLIVVPGDDAALPGDPSELVFLLAAPVEDSPGCIVVSAANAAPAETLNAAIAVIIIFFIVSSLVALLPTCRRGGSSREKVPTSGARRGVFAPNRTRSMFPTCGGICWQPGMPACPTKRINNLMFWQSSAALGFTLGGR